MEKKKLFGDTLKEQLIASSKDRLYNFILTDNIRGVLVHATRMINEMRCNHELGIIETLILGHAYIACALLSASLKGSDRIIIEIECSGPVKGLVAESNAFNEVRGYLKNIPVQISEPPDNFDTSRLFGAGFLSVTKHIQDSKYPYTGRIMIEHGSIARDLANYFLQSEQTPTSFNLSIKFDAQGNVAGAGGMFLQAMPGADENSVNQIEAIVKNFPSIGTVFSQGKKPEDIVMDTFREYSPSIISDRKTEFLCHCKRERMLDYLAVLPSEDLNNILETSRFPLEIICHNCNTRFSFEETEIKKIYTKRLH